MTKPVTPELLDDIQREREIADALAEALRVFLGYDERFQVAVGGNPNAVDAMLDKARAALATYEAGRG